MSPALIFANPSLMMLACLIGGAMREGVTERVFVKLLVIGALVPRLGAAMKAAMVLQEAMGDQAPWFCEDEPVDDAGDPCSGWVLQDEYTWVWHQVTKAAVWSVRYQANIGGGRVAPGRVRRRFRRANWSTLVPVFKNFSKLVLAGTRNCVLIVPIS